MIDLHCHVLPGIDDGPPKLEDSLSLCRAAHADGIRTIVATPHVSWSYPDVNAAVVDRQVLAVNQALRAAAIELSIEPGAELALSRASELSDDELRSLRLAGGTHVLLELPWTAVGAAVVQALRAVAQRGVAVVLAHPERSPLLQQDLPLVRALVDEGLLCCLNAGSLGEQADRRTRSAARRLLSEGLVHVIASDAHDARRRPPELRSALERAGLDAGEIDYFTTVAPEAIIHGAQVPPPPRVATRARHRWRRRVPS